MCPKPIIASDWYADNVPIDGVTPATELTARLGSAPARLITSNRISRGVALGLLARRSPSAALIKNAPGTLLALLIAALPPSRPTIVLLEFIRRPDPRSRWRRLAYRAWWHAIERSAVRRGMAVGQVLTEAERHRYVREYGLAPNKLELVRWPLARTASSRAKGRGTSRLVLASGRAACDWETLFAAAALDDWPLTVVCSRADLPRVEALNGDRRARVHSEVPWEEHERLLDAAGVYALVLVDTGSSSGHVRLMTAVEHGVPVVATRVQALAGYARENETALLVPPADPEALAAAIARVLSDESLGDRLVAAANASARAWTHDQYFAAIGDLVVRATSGTER